MKITSHLKTPPFLKAVSDFLAESRVESYLVGGALRDLVLERDTADLDIAVRGEALEIARNAASALSGKYVPLDEVNGVARVMLPGQPHRQLDLNGFKGGIESDLGRRDFTVDALAVDLSQLGSETLQIVDPYHGLDDLRQSIIRVVADDAFRQDPLRLLRAVRLAGELGFTIEQHTEALIQRDCHLLSQVAGERIREELLRILAIPGDGQWWHYLDRLGLVTELFPELETARGVSQPKEHHWDVFHHSLMTVAAASFLLRQSDWEYAPRKVLEVVPWSPRLEKHFMAEVSHGSTRAALLKLSALLHDVAKAETKTITENGRTRFLGHASLGAETASAILSRLRFSTREIKLVETEVKHHLRPTQMSHSGLPSHRAIYRYFRDSGEAGLDTLYLSLADHLAARGPDLDPAEWRRHTEVVDYVTKRHFEETGPARPPRIINGHDLMRAFGLSQGPGIGELLESVYEARAAGELSSKEEALKFASSLLASSRRSHRRKERGQDGSRVKAAISHGARGDA
jgi:poly(A) polymerase